VTLILVTGSTGTAGTAFKKIFTQFEKYQFYFIGSRDCNLTNFEDTLNFLQKNSPNFVIHLASVSGGIGISLKYPATVLKDNLLMNLNILEACRLSNVEKVIMTLSSGMYPKDSPNPLKEEYIHLGNPHPSNYSYAFAKRLVDPLIKSYREEYGLNAIGLIPNGIYGENDCFNLDDANMLAALIRRFYENKNNDKDIIVWGDGSPLREYTYSEDIARAYMWCLENYNNEQILNIGSIEEKSVKDIAYMVAEMMNIDNNRIKFDISKPSGQYRKSTDNNRFVSLSNFNYTPFKIGLSKTIEWFIKSYEDTPDILRYNSKIGH